MCYYLFVYFYNNLSVIEFDLWIYCVVFLKMVYSLIWEMEIVLLCVVEGSFGVVLVVDFCDYGWNCDGLWWWIVENYFYGLFYDFVEDE